MMQEIKDTLLAEAGGYGFTLSPTLLDQLERYAELLVDYNQKVNLTAITQPREIALLHFLDSMLLRVALEGRVIDSLADVGTGAGFPGMVLKLLEPGIDLTLIDSLNKRIAFLEQLAAALSVKVTALHLRAEEAGREQSLREQFSVTTARAVAPLPVLCEYCLPLTKIGGVFAAMKAKEADAEAQSAQNAITLLGGKLLEIRAFTLPDGDERSVVLIEKISHTPTKYPRPAGKLAKYPL